jgi:uncharacterized secreted protein with C-terminal beta-propeller domain
VEPTQVSSPAPIQPHPNHNLRNLFLGLILLVAVSVVLMAYVRNPKKGKILQNLIPKKVLTSQGPSEFSKFEKFTSEKEFKEYLQKASSQSNQRSGGAVDLMMKTAGPESMSAPMTGAVQQTAPSGGEQPERVSTTNVQVLGIDEPDIVKTNGSDLYYSGIYNRMYTDTLPRFEEGGRDVKPGMIMPGFRPDFIANAVRSFHIFPVSTLAQNATIPVFGDLLLSKNNLVVFNEGGQGKRGLYGYDVSDPKNPKEAWKLEYKDNTYNVQSRLYNKKLYVVTKTGMDISNPCPVAPMMFKDQPISIPCIEIYHPFVPVSTDSVFTVSRIDPSTGNVEKTLSFVGSSNESVMYMSKESLYVTYFYTADYIKIFNGFISENVGLFPDTVTEKLLKLESYDISQQAKMIEFETILNSYLNNLDNDQRLTFQNNLTNKAKEYMAKRARDFEKTGIVKINVSNFSIDALGDVSGKPLNQFSLDEYKGNLRIATTIGNNGWFWQFGPTSQNSFSDVNVLDSNLESKGSIQDLGKTERIYSTRFVQDRGYVVTFRQTDPFYVLDLSNASNPKLAGELKIPGYSSYLHPLAEHLVLGVGKENQNVKLSLFDVRSAENPLEIDKYQLDEYWSEVLNTSRAFLPDEQHKIFFIPGSKGGYIFSYADEKLKLVKAFEGMQAKRAVYVNNYLYIVTDNSLIVVDENTWERVKDFNF